MTGKWLLSLQLLLFHRKAFTCRGQSFPPTPKARGDCCNFSGARDLTCLLIGVNTQHSVRLVRPVDLVQHLLRMRS